jgi:DNA polymerase-1
MGDDDALYLIDGNSLALPGVLRAAESIATSTGFPTNAIFGFLRAREDPQRSGLGRRG